MMNVGARRELREKSEEKLKRRAKSEERTEREARREKSEERSREEEASARRAFCATSRCCVAEMALSGRKIHGMSPATPLSSPALAAVLSDAADAPVSMLKLSITAPRPERRNPSYDAAQTSWPCAFITRSSSPCHASCISASDWPLAASARRAVGRVCVQGGARAGGGVAEREAVNSVLRRWL